MFYQLDDEVTTIEYSELNGNLVTAGYLTKNEFSLAGVDGSEPSPGCSADIFENRTIATLRNSRLSVKLVIRKNLFIVVDFSSGELARNSFMQMLGRYSPMSVSVSKLIYAFFDCLISDSARELEKFGFGITSLEESVLSDRAGEDFNLQLLEMKKALLVSLSFYKRLLGVCEVIAENENEVITEDLNYLENLIGRVERIKADINALQDAVIHLQEAYSAYLDLKLNRSMKIFTVITSVFFPLTVITSWYGMNFSNMPELEWKYGYLLVALLSACFVSILILTGRRRKWF